MTKIYRNQKEVYYNDKSFDYVRFILELFVSAITLMIASKLFDSFYVENIWYALLASLVISILNVSIKPILIYFTLPVTIMSLGVLYPIVNVIILKLTGVILESSFVVSGWLVPFFISIFISIVTKILKDLVLGAYKGGNL